MQKTDAYVAAAGALILVLATAGAALTSGVGEDAARYAVAYPTREIEIGSGEAPLSPQAQTRGYDLVAPANLTTLRLRATVSGDGALPLAPGATASATLTAPDGTVVEKSGQAAPTGGAIDLVFEIPIQPAPSPRVVEAEGPDAARAQAAEASSAGAGAWTLRVTGPATGGRLSWQATAVQWTLEVAPDVTGK